MAGRAIMARKNGKTRTVAVATGAVRRAHFANGGTVASWRGRPVTMKDRRAEWDRRACRGRVTNEG